MKGIDFDFVADLYDSYVTVDFDVDFFKKAAEECRGKCLELMCGTGRVSLPLLKHGIDLTCVDYSEGMLRVLGEKLKGLNTGLRIECQDVCDLDLNESYKLIFIPFNSFSEISDTARQEAALGRIHAHLDICFSLIGKEDFAAMASKAGFRVKAVYGDYDFYPYTETSRFMNFMLVKSGASL